jgi:1-acyl-sn-glycerol-3-phosphate acyltransferase
MSLRGLQVTARLIAVTGALIVIVPAHIIARRGRSPSAPATFALRLTARLLRLRYRCEGERSCAPVLFAANHVSWADIPVLGACAQASFAAKSEVRGWPLLGWLAAQHGTIFLKRTRRSDAERQRDAIAHRLASGGSVILFAEGTSSDGSDVLPFKPALFDAAMRTNTPVQPVTIVWERVGSAPVTEENRLRIAWIGGMTLPPHLISLVKSGGATARIVFHPVLTPADFPGRRELALRCHELVASALPQAALRNRSE